MISSSAKSPDAFTCWIVPKLLTIVGKFAEFALNKVWKRSYIDEVKVLSAPLILPVGADVFLTLGAAFD